MDSRSLVTLSTMSIDVALSGSGFLAFSSVIISLKEYRIQYSEARIQYSGARIQHSEARIQYSEARIQYSEARIQYSEARIQYSEARIQYSGARIQYSGARIQYSEADIVLVALLECKSYRAVMMQLIQCRSCISKQLFLCLLLLKNVKKAIVYILAIDSYAYH